MQPDRDGLATHLALLQSPVDISSETPIKMSEPNRKNCGVLMNNQLAILPPYNLRPWDGSSLNEIEMSELIEKNNSEEIKEIRLKSRSASLTNIQAIKNCLKLFDMNVASLMDADTLKLKVLKIVQSGLLSIPNFSDFNFHEIRTIIDCFKLDHHYPGKKAFIDHLSAKIAPLAKEEKKIMENTLLLLKSKKDSTAFQSMFHEDIFREVALQCIKTFVAVPQTPVDISSKKPIKIGHGPV